MKEIILQYRCRRCNQLLNRDIENETDEKKEILLNYGHIHGIIHQCYENDDQILGIMDVIGRIEREVEP